MKKMSPESIIILILMLIAIALIAVGAARENIVLALSGFGLGFAAVFIGSLVTSVIKIRTRFPLRDDPTQKKIRAARYLSAAASFVITIGIIMVFVGIFMDAHGTQLFLHLAWALLAVGVAMAVSGLVLSAVMSKQLSTEQTVSNVPPSVPAANIPYSPDPVISRILANPYVLLDERIRQITEVQNLLQYPEIQQIFFEPAKLYSLFTNDRVGELMNIVRDRLTHNDGEEIFAAAEQRRFANLPQPTNAVQPENPAKTNNSGIKVSGNPVVAAIFIIVFVVLFIVTAFASIIGESG